MTYQGEEIPINEDKLIEILCKYEARSSAKSFFPYNTDKALFEIDYIENHSPNHIILGEIDVWYESSDQGAYEIVNAQKLKQEITDLMQSQ